jgi:hypothetical protein
MSTLPRNAEGACQVDGCNCNGFRSWVEPARDSKCSCGHEFEDHDAVRLWKLQSGETQKLGYDQIASTYHRS